jgi:3-phosphoshikimate 1-carboxyvinyltransferase
MATVRFEPSGSLTGALRPPPDKSISHRAALVGAMADGLTRVGGYLDSADTRATLAAVSAIGATVREREAREERLDLEIEGLGLRGPTPAEIDVGNAGTLLRIIPGWLAGQGGGDWVLDGDESVRRRPVDRIAEPLREMGAEVSCREDRLPPLRVRGAELRGIDHRPPVASAQVKSCLLLAGLLAEGPTTVREPAPSRDHTERMLAAAGAGIEREGTAVSVTPAERLEAGDIEVPGDFSSAAFALVAALVVPGSEVELRRVGLNQTRIGLLSILARMGVPMGAATAGASLGLAVDLIGDAGPEPYGTLWARHSDALRGAVVSGGDVPLAIDELPLVALLGCFAEGETVVRDAGELRHKESDRIAGVVEGLRGLGAEIEATGDGFAVRGTGQLRGGTIDARGDHRLAMLGAVAGLASQDGVAVGGFEAVEVSYPRFEADLRSLLVARR